MLEAKKKRPKEGVSFERQDGLMFNRFKEQEAL